MTQLQFCPWTLWRKFYLNSQFALAKRYYLSLSAKMLSMCIRFILSLSKLYHNIKISSILLFLFAAKKVHLSFTWIILAKAQWIRKIFYYGTTPYVCSVAIMYVSLRIIFPFPTSAMRILFAKFCSVMFLMQELSFVNCNDLFSRSISNSLYRKGLWILYYHLRYHFII